MNSIKHRIFGFGIGFLSAWTVGAHFITLYSHNFDHLYIIFLVSILFAISISVSSFSEILSNHRLFQFTTQGGLKNFQIRAETPNLNAFISILILILSALYQYKYSEFIWFWSASIAISLYVLLKYLMSDVDSSKSIPTKIKLSRENKLNNTVFFIFTTLFLLLFYFFTSIPDADDSLFLNLAIQAKENRQAVYLYDNMLGIDHLEMIKSTYRIESYQLLAALVSDLTGLSVLFSAHTVLPVFIILWASATLIIIHEFLFGNFYRLSFIVHFTILIIMDGAFQSFGYHAIPRLFQGKGPFVMVMVPLIFTVTIIFIQEYDWKSIVLIGLSIIIGIGFTANAVYVAPLVSLLVIAALCLCRASIDMRVLRIIFVLVYPCALIGWLLFFDPPAPSENALPGTVDGTLWVIFGDGSMLIVSLLFIAACFVMPFYVHGSSVLSMYFLLIGIFVLNPFIWELYGRYVTGNVNYRLFWSVPFPLIVTIVLVVGSVRSLRIVRVVGAVVLAVGVVGPSSVLHHADFGLSFIKVPEVEFELAEMVVESGGGDELTLGPERIVAWLPVLEGGPPVVEARGLYIPQRRYQGERENLAMRAKLFKFWNGYDAEPMSHIVFESLIIELDVQTVIIEEWNPRHTAFVDVFVQEGFRRSWEKNGVLMMNR